MPLSVRLGKEVRIALAGMREVVMVPEARLHHREAKEETSYHGAILIEGKAGANPFSLLKKPGG